MFLLFQERFYSKNKVIMVTVLLLMVSKYSIYASFALSFTYYFLIVFFMIKIKKIFNTQRLFFLPISLLVIVFLEDFILKKTLFSMNISPSSTVFVIIPTLIILIGYSKFMGTQGSRTISFFKVMVRKDRTPNRMDAS